MKTFQIVLLVAFLSAAFLVAKSKKEPYEQPSNNFKSASWGSKPVDHSAPEVQAERQAYDKWIDDREKVRMKLGMEFDSKLKGDAKAVNDKFVKLYGSNYPIPQTAGTNKISFKDALNKLTDTEKSLFAKNSMERRAYITSVTNVKCNPKLWHGDNFDPSKYTYAERVQDEIDGTKWTCNNNEYKDKNQFTFDTGCSWGDKGNETRQCAVYMRRPAGAQQPPQPVPL